MPSVTGVVKSTYYIGKLLLVAIFALAYFRWRIWRAKHTFKAGLVRGGMPRDSVNLLVNHYDAQNKQLLGSLISFASLSRGKPRANPLCPGS